MAKLARSFSRLLWLGIAPGLAVSMAGAVGAHAVETVAAAPPCTLEPGPIHTVTRVLDGETVALDDGSEVRLIGALAPRARDGDAAEGTWPPENEAIAALKALVLGHTVKLTYGGQRSDRYGRSVAHLFADKDGESVWVQGELLKMGHARAYGLFDNFACAHELLEHEMLARNAHLGLWGLSLYRPKPAAQPRLLMHVRSQFHIVAGRVRNVSRTKTAVYLNFGDDWKTDFTARIGKSVLSKNAEWAAKLEALQGQEIAVRGWIERRNGPMIDVIDPAQIELAWPPSTTAPDQPEAPAVDPETTSVPEVGGQTAPPTSKQKRPEPKVPDAVNL